MALLTQLACVDWVAVKPTEVTKLGNGYAKEVARSGNTTLIAVSVTDVERTDGTLQRVNGPADVRLHTTQTPLLELKTPFRAELDGDSLVVQSDTLPRTLVPFNTVQSAEVGVYNQGKSIAAYFAGALVGAALIYAIVSAAAPEPASRSSEY